MKKTASAHWQGDLKKGKKAKLGCPISKLLKAEITLDATLQS